jgi:adenylate kinase
MIICISGTPGVGKTTISKKLEKKLKIKVIDVNKLIKKLNLIEGYDKKRNAFIVDENKLKKIKLNGNFIIDGHLSQFIPNDLTIVLRLHPKKLRERLEAKKWKKEKIEENVIAEALDIIYVEALKCKKEKIAKNVVQINTTNKSVNSIVKRILNMLKEEKYKSDYVDWLSEYEDIW